MAEMLPLFPLQLVVFPNEKLNLHIFEDRYKQLIQESSKAESTFVIPPFIGKKIMPFATEIQLLNIEKSYDSGEMDIRTQGLGIIELGNIINPYPGKLYIGGEITRLPHSINGDFFKSEQLIELIRVLFTLLAIEKEVPENIEAFRTFEFAHHVGLSIEQEYQLLQLVEEMDRQDYLLSHLNQMIPKVKEINRLKERAKMNGHFKNIIPPKI